MYIVEWVDHAAGLQISQHSIRLPTIRPYRLAVVHNDIDNFDDLLKVVIEVPQHDLPAYRRTLHNLLHLLLQYRPVDNRRLINRLNEYPLQRLRVVDSLQQPNVLSDESLRGEVLDVDSTEEQPIQFLVFCGLFAEVGFLEVLAVLWVSGEAFDC